MKTMATKTKATKPSSMPPNHVKGWHFVSWSRTKTIPKWITQKAYPAPRYKVIAIPAWPSSGWKYGIWFFDNEAKPKKKKRKPSWW